VSEDKDKKTSLKEKVGLFIDKKLTFGGGLSVSQKVIDAAEEAVGVDSYKDIETQAQFDKFKKIMNQMAQQERQGETPAKGASGGMVKKMKNGGAVNGKRLTRTVPPKKGPNSQGMRGTGAAIRGTKFKGVF
jgi:hypothetical protein|tara:strand:- start:232 stop:627 length:396 start_codon:yes stop_codon:yes gene_type:complete